MSEKSFTVLDTNKDGKITHKDITYSEKIQDIQQKVSKFSNQTKMAWLSLISMILATAFLFSPYIDITKIHAITEIVIMLYITLSGIVATYMGVTAWIYQKNKENQ